MAMTERWSKTQVGASAIAKIRCYRALSSLGFCARATASLKSLKSLRNDEDTIPSLHISRPCLASQVLFSGIGYNSNVPTVNTTSGLVSGHVASDTTIVSEYLGIPYARSYWRSATSSGGPSPTSSKTSSASLQVLDLSCLLVLILLCAVTITS